MRSIVKLFVLLGLGVAACDRSPTGTGIDPRNLTIAVQGGDQQFGPAGAQLPDPIQVVVLDARTKEAVKGVSVTWRVTSSPGGGAEVSPGTSTTDSAGVATARVRLGQTLGTYVVQASFNGLTGNPPTFTLNAAVQPAIATAPRNALAGDTITIVGVGFSPRAEDNTVTFAGIRAAVTSATTTQLRVVVPQCVPTRNVQLVAALGALASSPVYLDVMASSADPLHLQKGEVRSFFDPAELACVRLADEANALYGVVIQNATDVASRTMPAQLLSVLKQWPIPATAFSAPAGTPGTMQDTWELSLRMREQSLRAPTDDAQARISARQAPPSVGDQRTFSVINKDSRFTKVTATIRHISSHAIIYEDVAVPPNGFDAADYARLGQVFDNVIYATDVSVFGQPSDIDGNEKVIILFTPIVNDLTPAGASSFIAAFFYGCDLVDPRECSGTNRSEMFYSLVPDLNGLHGMRHTRDEVMRTIQPVLAHEFQHMIHFNERVLVRKAATQESLWLSEGLAHLAEDTVGGVLAKQGDAATAFDFRRLNYTRAQRYLSNPSPNTLLSFVAPGSLEERGAAWLFIRYLMSRFTYDILHELTQTTASSTTNVTTQTQTAWNVLINDWTVALLIDDRPDLAGVPVDPRYTYRDINLQTLLADPRIAGPSAVYPLRPQTRQFGDFSITDNIAASSARYLLLQAGTLQNTLNLSLSAPGGGPFVRDSRPQISIVRLR